jgi:hypothetical protein
MPNTYEHPNLIYGIKKTEKKYKVGHLKNLALKRTEKDTRILDLVAEETIAPGEQIEEISDREIAETKRSKQTSNTAALVVVSNEDPRQTNAELLRSKEQSNTWIIVATELIKPYEPIIVKTGNKQPPRTTTKKRKIEEIRRTNHPITKFIRPLKTCIDEDSLKRKRDYEEGEQEGEETTTKRSQQHGEPSDEEDHYQDDATGETKTAAPTTSTFSTSEHSRQQARGPEQFDVS